MASTLTSQSLYRLVWLALFVVALFPSLLVSFLLVDRVAEQSREQVHNSLSHKVEIQAELLEREFNQQFSSLLQLSQITDVALAPSSSIFGFQAGIHLRNFIEKSPIGTAIYILDREHWTVEVAPLYAELAQLQIISPKVEQLLTKVEVSQEVEHLVFNINDPAIASLLSSKMSSVAAKIDNNWILVIVLPLIQATEQAATKFTVQGSLLFLQPLKFVTPLLKSWQPKGGALSILEGDNELITTGIQSNNTEHFMTLDSEINLNDKSLILRSREPLASLQAIVFEDVWRLSLLVAGILLIVILIAFFVTHLVKVQLLKLTSQVKAFALGDYQFRVPGLRFSEFIQVSAVLEQLSSKVINDQAQLEQKVSERTKALSQVNSELSATLEALQETQDKLVQSEKMASLGQMVAGIAHELNTPLGICVTAVGLIEEASHHLSDMLLNGAIKKSSLLTQLDTLSNASGLVSRNVRRSSDLVALFKELSLDSEIEDKQQFALHTFMQKLCEVWQGMQSNTHLDIRLSSEELIIASYQGTLRKVLSILFDNAQIHAFNQTGQGILELYCRKKSGFIEIDFCDNGPGVSIEPISRIFEPFYTSGRGGGNVGLGLHLAYNLVTQRLNGDIKAQNRRQGGLQITLKLPYTALVDSKTE